METGRAAAAVLCLAIFLACSFSAAASAETVVLLRDDFDGSALDTTKWFVPTGDGTFFGRTQIRPPSVPLTVADGRIRLQLDTYNPCPMPPCDSFLGSEFRSVDSYEVELGLEFEARVRLVAPLPGGLVGAVFSFVFLPPDRRDEIDFELLSNDLVASEERVFTNVFENDDFSQPGAKAFAPVAGLDLSAFNTYTVRWLPDRVEWFVNGALVRTETTTVPDDPMNVRLNFWAPNMFFVEAYDASLQPAAVEEDNEIYFTEVDYVEIRRVVVSPPLLSPLGLLLMALALGAAGAFAARQGRGFRGKIA